MGKRHTVFGGKPGKKPRVLSDCHRSMRTAKESAKKWKKKGYNVMIFVG